jgi:hypothetical protein
MGWIQFFKKIDTPFLIPESCTNYLLRLEAPYLQSSFHDFSPHHIGNMSAGQNHSNFAINTRLSSPRYDTWYKIQVIKKGIIIISILQILPLLHPSKCRYVSGDQSSKLI